MRLARGSLRTLDLANATEPLSKYVQAAEAEPLVLTRNGKIVAVIVAIEGESVRAASASGFLAIFSSPRVDGSHDQSFSDRSKYPMYD